MPSVDAVVNGRASMPSRVLRGVALGLLLLVTVAASCVREEREVHQTRVRAAMIVAELRALEAASMALPVSLRELCPRLAGCWGDGEPLDGWSRTFEYRTDGSSYVLVSGGADGALGTTDDVDFSPNTRAIRIERVAGCWVRTPEEDGRFELSRVWLDTARTAGGELAVIRQSGSLGGSWVPWTADSIRVSLAHSTTRVDLALHESEQQLVGEIIFGPAGTTFGRTERRRVAFKRDAVRSRDACIG